ncbi:tRNA-dependent cyclodipeptide synthase [Streptomyces syringium]|uniref:tRNA-dependent cyclodipeptide synthase n=1 Tax=Streptomyces syringium TaxID=76729 RepID=UPI00341AAA1B
MAERPEEGADMEFLVRPRTGLSRHFLERAEHALIGLGPWNIHDTPAVAEALVEWACVNFTAVDVVVPGYEAAHVLVAAGCPPRAAVIRAQRATSRLRNPAQRALRRTGVHDPRLHFHSWTQLLNRPAYTRTLARARLAYRTDEAVRRACRLAAREAVLGAAGLEPSAQQIDQTVGYAIAALPFLLESPAIFQTASSLFVHDQDTDLLAPFVNGRAGGLRPGPGQGYALVKPTSYDSALAHPL